MQAIHDYIAADSPRAAQKVVTGIYDRIQILADFPEIGYVYQREPDGLVRILLYGHYRIAYLLTDAETVTVLGVFHGAMDIERYL
jgi:plasmid stabilization system protein ParE